jgi:hypothetical protein
MSGMPTTLSPLLEAAFLVLLVPAHGPAGESAQSEDPAALCARLEEDGALGGEPHDSTPGAPPPTTWDALFRDGVKAHDRGLFRLSLRRMCQAIALRPHDDLVEVRIFSTRMLRYVPSTFAGIAAAEVGLCREAEVFHASARDQVIAPEREPSSWRELEEARREFCGALDEGGG